VLLDAYARLPATVRMDWPLAIIVRAYGMLLASGANGKV
jgi:hypothetical protein